MTLGPVTLLRFFALPSRSCDSWHSTALGGLRYNRIMTREIVLYGGAYDGGTRNVDDAVTTLRLPTRVGEGPELVYQRVLDVDSEGRPLFLYEEMMSE